MKILKVCENHKQEARDIMHEKGNMQVHYPYPSTICAICRKATLESSVSNAEDIPTS